MLLSNLFRMYARLSSQVLEVAKWESPSSASSMTSAAFVQSRSATFQKESQHKPRADSATNMKFVKEDCPTTPHSSIHVISHLKACSRPKAMRGVMLITGRFWLFQRAMRRLINVLFPPPFLAFRLTIPECGIWSIRSSGRYLV